MPVICGSTTQSVATAATAASAAVPPARSTSTAARVASGCEVAAMPSQAITGERPGNAKSRLMAYPEYQEGSARNVLDTLDREIALRRAQRHGEAAEHVDKAYDEEKEKGRCGGLPDQQKLDQHAEE